MIVDYAPRLAARAKARRRRNTLFTALLLVLPALSFQTAPLLDHSNNTALVLTAQQSAPLFR